MFITFFWKFWWQFIRLIYTTIINSSARNNAFFLVVHSAIWGWFTMIPPSIISSDVRRNLGVTIFRASLKVSLNDTVAKEGSAEGSSGPADGPEILDIEWDLECLFWITEIGGNSTWMLTQDSQLCWIETGATIQCGIFLAMDTPNTGWSMFTLQLETMFCYQPSHHFGVHTWGPYQSIIPTDLGVNPRPRSPVNYKNIEVQNQPSSTVPIHSPDLPLVMRPFSPIVIRQRMDCSPYRGCFVCLQNFAQTSFRLGHGQKNKSQR